MVRVRAHTPSLSLLRDLRIGLGSRCRDWADKACFPACAMQPSMTMSVELQQSFREELANAISHGSGALLAIAAVPLLVWRASTHGGTSDIVAASVFAGSLVLMYAVSTLHHALPAGRSKLWFNRPDHAAIYVLIAGCYTPFTLGVLQGSWGWTLLILVWAMAAFGVTIKLMNRLKHRLVSTGLYLALGWLVVVAAGSLVSRLPGPGLALLVAGGLSYTLGSFVFLLDDRIRCSHFVWPLFMLGGSVCHFFAAFWYAYG